MPEAITLQSHRFSDRPQDFPLGVVEFLNKELRANGQLSIRDEYPAFFGDFPGGESLYIERDGKVVSHVGIMNREFQGPGFRFRLGLIGSVATDFKYRGQGFASHLLREAVSRLKQRGCVLALLWSDKADFYAPLGFHRAGQEWDLRFSGESVDSIEFPVREGAKDSDIPFLWRLYQKHEWRLDRSLEEMRELLRVPKSRVFITEQGGQPTSYFVVNKGADFTDYIHEWAGDLESLSKAVAVCQRLHFPDKELTLIAPKNAKLSQLKRQAVMEYSGVLGLVKIIDKNSLLATYIDYLNQHGRIAKRQMEPCAAVIDGKTVSLSTEQEILKLVLGGEGEPLPYPTLPLFIWGFDSI